MSKQKPKLNQNTIHRVLKLIRPYTGMVILTLTFAQKLHFILPI